MEASVARAEPASISDVVEIENPSFDTSYPNICFPERLAALPDGSRFFLDHCWLHGRFPPSTTRVIRLRDVFVAGEGLVFDRDLRVVQASISQHSEEQIRDARDLLDASRPRLAERRGPCVLCVKPGQQNFGHWLVEMLPRADIATNAYPALKPRVLVPSVDEPLRSVIGRSLELLGMGDRFDHALASPEWCEDLLIVQGLTEHGIYMSPLVFQTLDRMAAAVPVCPSGDRLYVRRSEPIVRRLANEQAIDERLQERGFTTIRPETMTLDQQIAAFRGARQVVGIAGAGLTSIAFSRPGTEATVFYPENMPDTFFWFLAQHRELTFTDIRCRLAGGSAARAPWDADVVLDPKVFAWYMQ